METNTSSSSKPYVPIRVSPPPTPIPPPTPPPPPEPLTHEQISPPVCDTPAQITAAPWLSTNSAIIIAATITLAITLEIVMKFVFLRRKKKKYEAYIDEKMEELELGENEILWKIIKRKLGL